MALTKEQKKKIIEDLKEKISRQKSVVFVDFSGIKSKEIFNLRKKLKSANCLFKVAKKTLLKIVLSELNAAVLDKIKNIPGQLALIFGFEEGNESAKASYNFLNENKNFKILGGFFEDKFREADEVITIAKLPGRQELLGILIRGVSAPITNFTNVLRGNLQNLVQILSKIKK